MEARGPIVTDHAHHRLVLFVGLLHLVMVSVDRCRFVVVVGTDQRPSGARVGCQVQRLHLMRGSHRQLGQVTGPQPFHVEWHVETLLATSANIALHTAATTASARRRLLTTDGPETGHMANNGRDVVSRGHAEVQ